MYDVAAEEVAVVAGRLVGERGAAAGLQPRRRVAGDGGERCEPGCRRCPRSLVSSRTTPISWGLLLWSQRKRVRNPYRGRVSGHLGLTSCGAVPSAGR